MTETSHTPDTNEGNEGQGHNVPPAHRIPMSSGAWRYSLGDDGHQRGVYMKGTGKNARWEQVAPLPHITTRLTDRDGEGSRTNLRYRLTMDLDAPASTATVCDRRDIITGEWAVRLDVPVSADRKILDAVATAIFDASHHEGVDAAESVPQWQDGHLVMPPADMGPDGYQEYAADEERALQAWRDIARVCADNPKLGLCLGAAVGGLYMGPLDRQPFIVDLVGAARRGKSTGLFLGAGALGWAGSPRQPAGVLRTANSSAQGMHQMLRGLSVLPAFADETGTAKRTVAQREEFIMSVAQGDSRTMGERGGLGGKRTPRWSGVYLSSGNESIGEGVSNEGTWARVLSIRTPITATPAAARRISELVPLAYGWPFQWVMRDPDVDGMRARVARAETDMPMPDGGVPETIAENLAVLVAGARLVGEMVGVEFDGPVLDEARAILAAMTSELEERGATPADRLMSAVLNSWATHPDTFPDLSTYKAAFTKTPLEGEAYPPKLPPVVDGLVLAEPPALAVFPSRLGPVARESDITDPGPGVGDLVAEGRMLANHGRQRKVSITTTKKRGMYVFLLEDEPDEATPTDEGQGDTGGPGPHGQDTPDTSGTSPNTRTDPAVSPPEQPESAVTENDAPTWENTTMDEALDEVTEPAHEATPEPAEPAPARVSTTPPTTRPTHRRRRDEAPAPRPVDEVLALAADTETLYTYGATGLSMSDPGTLLSNMGRFLDYAARAMPTGGTVALDAAAAESLGYPDFPERFLQDDTDPNQLPMPDRPRVIQEAAAAGWHVSAAIGVDGWTTYTRGTNKDPDQVSITVACLEWMDPRLSGTTAHTMFTMHTDPADTSDEPDQWADTPDTAVYLLGRVRELTGTPWAYTGGSTWSMGVRDQYMQRNGLPRPDLDYKTAVPRLKQPVPTDGGRRCVAFDTPDPGLRWRRPGGLDGGRHRERFVIGYDVNAAHLAAANGLATAVNDLHEVDAVEWNPSVSGIWLMDPINDTYGDGAGPPLAGPAASTTGPWWAHTVQVQALIRWGLVSDEFTTRAWVPLDKGRPVAGSTQVMRKYGERVRDALKQIPRDTPDELESRVRDALKSQYAEAAGQMGKANSPWLRRPDWAMGIWSGSRVNVLRTVVRIYDATGQWPLEIATDALYYETTGTDPDKNNPAPGILRYDESGTKLGQYKSIFAGTMDEYVAKRTQVWKGGN